MNSLNISKKIIFIPCSGADYNGELSRKVAIQLSDTSFIANSSSMLCFTIFLRHSLLKEEDSFKRIKDHLVSSYVVIIDGCSGSCAFKILKFLDINPDLVINLTKLVPKKPLDFKDIESFKNRPCLSKIKTSDIEKVSNHILQLLKEKKIINN